MQKLIPGNASLIPNIATRVFQGQVFDVYQWPQAAFNGETWTFEMLRRPDTVQAICIVEDKVIILNDEQPHVGKRLSLPGGRIDTTDTSIELAAKREVLEETGYSFKNWRLVSVVQPYVKNEWFVHTFVTWGVIEKVDIHLDGGEIIEEQLLDLPAFRNLVEDDQVILPQAHRLLKDVTSTDDLTRLPAFVGKVVDR